MRRRNREHVLPPELATYDPADWAPEGVSPRDPLQAHYFGLLDYREARAKALGVHVSREFDLPITWAHPCVCRQCVD